MGFSEAQAQAWQYFENALSVHTELMLTPTGLPAVQALASMASLDKFLFNLKSFNILIGILR